MFVKICLRLYVSEKGPWRGKCSLCILSFPSLVSKPPGFSKHHMGKSLPFFEGPVVSRQPRSVSAGLMASYLTQPVLAVKLPNAESPSVHSSLNCFGLEPCLPSVLYGRVVDLRR